MATKKSRKQRRAPAVTPVAPAQAVDLGRKVSVAVKKTSVDEVVLTLMDGTKMRLKPLIVGVERSLEKYNPDGTPVYQVNVALVVQTDVARKLKRKIK